VKPSSGKAKGRRLQQWAMNLILDRFTGLEPDDVTSRSMGSGGEDVLMSPKARKKFPFSIECKNTERLNLYRAYDQCKQNAGDQHEPLLIIKKNHSTPLAVVDAEWFIRNWRQ
jgi:hypothetical protein